MRSFCFFLPLLLFTLIVPHALFAAPQQGLKHTERPLFTCMPVPLVKPPPPQGPASSQLLEALPCPAGLVPQPIATTQPQIKGLPPEGLLAIAPGYHYVYAYQFIPNAGASAFFSQHRPYVNPLDYHSLAEIAVQSQDGAQIVEIGWTVDRGNTGDSNTHLFVFSWVNRVPNCYNGCGYIQYSPSVYPGMSIASDGTSHYQAIQHYNGNWWLNYDGNWIGYFPESVWRNKGVDFHQAGLLQWFGEVASNGGAFTQMGNGLFGSVTGAATISNTKIITSLGKEMNAAWALAETDPACFKSGMARMGESFFYGGPGC